MMRVATELRQSGVCTGLGLFAKEYVKAGSVIWRFVDGFDVKVHVSKLGDLLPVQRSYVETYFWREGEYLYTSCDNSVFQNHSVNANSGPKGEDMVALKDIFPGEEILVNYESFDDDFPTYAHDLKE
jgi:hypothetical protein